MAPRPPYSPAMKLATFRDGSRGGQLAVVSGDLARACYASGIAATLQQALHDWNFIAPQLQALANELNGGHARHAFTQCTTDPMRNRNPIFSDTGPKLN